MGGGCMDIKANVADNEDERRSPAEARPVQFSGLGGAAVQALAILRAVRHSGKDKLGLRDAIKVACQQGAAFKRWCERGTPVRRVQVWVENHLVMTVSPEDGSVKLNSFQFD